MTDHPEKLGPYVIQGFLGRGGMGTVFRARHESLGREVALKVLSEAGADERETRRKRFLREAAICARLTHPNIVRVFDFGHESGCLYYAMELIQGRDLAEVLEDQPVQGVPAAIRLAREVAAAFAHYFPQKLVHRDLKPANILLDGSGRAILTDFGLVKDLMATSITRDKAIVGTPSFIAPELIQGLPVTAAADIWSLGVILYRMLAGSLPFERKTSTEMLWAIVQQEPAHLSVVNPQVPAALATLVMNCLQKAPANRYASAEELQADLESAARQGPVASRARRVSKTGTVPDPAPCPSGSAARPPSARGSPASPSPGSASRAGPSPVRARWPARAIAAGLGLGLLLAIAFLVSREAGVPGWTTVPASPGVSGRALKSGVSLEALASAIESFDPGGRTRRLGKRMARATPSERLALLSEEASAARTSMLSVCMSRLLTAPEMPLFAPEASWAERAREFGWIQDLLLYDQGHLGFRRPAPLMAAAALQRVVRLESRVAPNPTGLTASEIPGSMARCFPRVARIVPLVINPEDSDTFDYENVRWTPKDSFGGFLQSTDKVRDRVALAPFELTPASSRDETILAVAAQWFDPQTIFLVRLESENSPVPLTIPLCGLQHAESAEDYYLLSMRLGPGVLPPGKYRGWLTLYRVFGFALVRPNFRIFGLVLPGNA